MGEGLGRLYSNQESDLKGLKKREKKPTQSESLLENREAQMV